MPQSTLDYVLRYIHSNIPPELLTLAFNPRKFSTTIDQRIITTIIEGDILQDTNLVGGKRREISVDRNWLMDIGGDETGAFLGTGIEGAFYQVPPEAREFRNISSVISVTPFIGAALPGTGVANTGGRQVGNTASGMLSEMLNSRTFANTAVVPQVTLEGSNIIRFYPALITSGVSVSVMLEYDSEFINMNTSAIKVLRELCLIATMRYIATNLRVKIDESEIVAGMEIGVIKTLVEQYAERVQEYEPLLIKLRGALLYDTRSISRLIYHAL